MKLKTALMGAVATFAVAQMAYADAHEGERGRDKVCIAKIYQNLAVVAQGFKTQVVL